MDTKIAWRLQPIEADIETRRRAQYISDLACLEWLMFSGTVLEWYAILILQGCVQSCLVL